MRWSLVLLDFDTTQGPTINKVIGDLKFDETEWKSMKCCAFPDSNVSLRDGSWIFMFTVGSLYCFAIFMTRQSESAVRGFVQNTIVIVTDTPHIYPMTRLLHSSLNLSGNEPEYILTCIDEFLHKWQPVYPKKEAEEADIPMFDGILHVAVKQSMDDLLSFVGGFGWNQRSNVYLVNESFLGIDLVPALDILTLVKNRRTLDVLKLWELAIIGGPLLVFGSSPTVTCTTALTIASLVFPEVPSMVLYPYISVSDPRFTPILEGQAFQGIVGVSNLIAKQNLASSISVFQIGPEMDSVGLNTKPQTWSFLKKHTSSFEIRKRLCDNTFKVIEAINNYLTELHASFPYFEFIGQFNKNHLESHLTACSVESASPISDLAEHLLKSPFFIEIWRRRCTPDSFTSALSVFSVSEACKKWDEHALVDLITTLIELRKRYRDHPDVVSLIERDYLEVEKLLPSDLVLAPLISDTL